MNQGKALFQAILDDPDDVVRRLVYADWLEDQGDDDSRLRAEFIRLEHQQTILTEEDPRWHALQERRSAISRECSDSWYPELCDLIDCLDETWCGFPDAITISMKDFVKNGDAIFARAPVRRVLFIDNGRKNLAALLACPALRHVRATAFGDGVYGDAITYAGARKLAACPLLGNLVELDLFESRISAAGMEALAASPHIRKLRVLEVPDNYVLDRGAEAIARAEDWELETLNLRNSELTVRGLRALVGAPHLRGLKTLSLMNNRIGPEVGAILAASDWQLTDLDLAGTGLSADAMARLTGSPFLSSLHKLRVCWNPLGTAGVLALFASPHVAGLKELDLADAGLDAEGVRQMTGAWRFAGLRDLRLDNNKIGDEGTAHLARCSGLQSLRMLQVSGVGLTDQGVRELAESPHVAGLRSLWLNDAGLSDAAVEALVASPHLSRQVYVSLSSQHLSEDAKKKLADWFRRL